MPRSDPNLEKLIDQASVDTDTIDDVAMGLCYGIQEHVKFPVPGRVVGEDVSVVGVEEGEGVDVVAICERKGRKYRVRLDDVTISVRPKGIEWLDAYRLFKKRGY